MTPKARCSPTVLPSLPLSPLVLALALGCGNDDDGTASADGTGGETDATTSGDDQGSGGQDGETGGGSGSAEGGSTSGTLDDTAGSADDTGDSGDTATTGDGGDGGVLDACDEPGTTRSCWSFHPDQQGVGACADGEQTCLMTDDGPSWGPCEDEQGPSAEVCDGEDNDCNGTTDDSLGEIACGLGACAQVMAACVDGTPAQCDPLLGATAETCDGIDNNCDGNVDEGLGGAIVQCGLGVCAHTVNNCDGGQLPTCDPLLNSSDEVCDGLDNDCDGIPDDGLPVLSCGQGACAKVVPSCVDGIALSCDPFEGVTTEVCDSIDNDCDGLTDEGLGVWICGTGECQGFLPTCIEGISQAAEACEPGGIPEICGDGLDNDCDQIAAACAETFTIGAEEHARPIDVVWVIDSSGSMAQELATVEAELNDFAAVLDAAPSSNALHLIGDRGLGEFQICIGAPLGGAGCGDNPPRFWHLDTNGSVDGQPFVHSSNGIGRLMQQFKTWGPRLQPNSFIAFVFTTDDDGDDPQWVAPEDDSPVDDCNSFNFINDSSYQNRCLWNDPDGDPHYTSLANDHAGRLGFLSFMADKLPGHQAGLDWKVYSIIGDSGTGLPAGQQFSCPDSVESGDEYVKLSLATDTADEIVQLCALDWDFAGLAESIVTAVPVDRYVLSGSPAGTCGNIDTTSIVVSVDGVELDGGAWSFDASECTVILAEGAAGIGASLQVEYDNL